ncbi:MAG: hypothetical protein K8R53_11390, partial [Bacteroidales bacterium]|nr:hypothetical protein [Bacteroidales bacterium]
LQVSLDGGTTWTDLWNLSGDQGDQWFNALVDLSAYESLNNVMIRFLGTTGIGYRSDMAIDYFNVYGNQPPPPCATLVYPPDEGIHIPIDAQLEWNAAPDATGYLIWFGTDNPPTNIENGTDLGDVLTYIPPSYIEMLTNYYWKIVPYNATGQATACPTFSFTTELSPPRNLLANANGFDAHLNWVEPLGVSSANVLCVDRDGSADLNFVDTWQYLQPALDNLGVNYTYYEVTDLTQDGPDLSTMLQYEIIFWFAGEGWQNNQTMSVNDELNLATYLDNGGNLLLSSQDYLWDRYFSYGNFVPGEFPYDYLGVLSTSQDYWHVTSPVTALCSGITGSIAEAIDIEVADIYSAKDGIYIDQIVTAGQNLFEVTDPAPQDFAACQYTGNNFKTVFTTVSLAAITDPAKIESIIGNAISWMSVVKDKSFLSYNVYRDNTLIDNTGNTEYIDPGLPAGNYDYFVKALYTEGESLPSNIVNVSIAPPGCASLIYPENESINIPLSASLSWDQTPDASGYLIWFGTDYPPSNIENGTDLGNVTTYTPAAQLNGLTEYNWKIVPYNVVGQATGCSIWSFTTGANPNPPPQNLQAAVQNDFDVLLTWDEPLYKQTLYDEDFESYSVGDFMAVENPTWWTTWSNQPGSPEDIPVSGDEAYSGSKSIIIQNTTDGVLKLGDKTSGQYKLDFWCYIPTGYGGYYNIQHFETPATEWAYSVYFGANGSAQLDAGINAAATFNYPKDQWILIENSKNIDEDWTVLKVNGGIIYEWPFHYQSNNTNGTNQLGSLNIYAGGFTGETPKYYVDDISFTQLLADNENSKDLLGYNI